MKIEEDEQWKEIEGYAPYRVSDKGRVMGYGGVLRPSTCNKGYKSIILSKEGKRKSFYVHRLVAFAFVPNPDPEHLTQVNHIDEDKGNNVALNIEWVSHQRNITYGNRTKNMVNTIDKNRDRRKPVIAFKLNEEELKITDVMSFDSINQASNALGVQSSAIRSCLQGVQKTSKGWRFELK